MFRPGKAVRRCATIIDRGIPRLVYIPLPLSPDCRAFRRVASEKEADYRLAGMSEWLSESFLRATALFHTLNIGKRVVSDRIDQRIKLHRIVQVLQIVRPAAR